MTGRPAPDTHREVDMSMLTGPEIARQVELGAIQIRPFDPARLNPNSYNLTLGDRLRVYEKAWPLHVEWDRLYDLRGRMLAGGVAHPHLKAPDFVTAPLDMRAREGTIDLSIPDGGVTLYPGVLYLGSTTEFTSTFGFAPVIEGRSSVARLGVAVHLTAGFGDNGFHAPSWTLEMTVVHPVRVYAGVEICQIAFSTLEGRQTFYQGKYNGQDGPTGSRMHMDFDNKQEGVTWPSPEGGGERPARSTST
jgi:deoxycytidine triphosphate deaminase